MMPDLIVPISAYVDRETAKVIAELRVAFREAQASADSWKRQADDLRLEKERHYDDRDKLKALKEKMEPFVRDLMDFLGIDESDSWY